MHLNEPEQKVAEFCINQFMGSKNTKTSSMDDLMKIVAKIENEPIYSGSKTLLRTTLDTLENERFEGRQYKFCIVSNNGVIRYSHTSSMKEASIIMAIIAFCKDWYLQKIILNKSKK